MTRFRAYWRSPWGRKWGRLLVFLAVIELVWLWFQQQHTITQTDRKWIVSGVVVACAVALLASAVTTRRYSLRGLGLFGVLLGIGFLCGWLALNYWDQPSPPWVIDQAAAALVIGAPALTIGTVLAIVHRLRGEPVNGGAP